jgi:hypothetical protein
MQERKFRQHNYRAMKRHHQVSWVIYSGSLAASLVLSTLPAPADTVAWWRFEEGPADAQVSHPVANGLFYPSVADSSGHGNALSAWTGDAWAGYGYRTDLPGATIPQTGAANNYSVQNTGGYPGMFTGSAAMQTMTPGAWTVEASFKPESGGYRTLVGRDSMGAYAGDANLAALYLQIIPDDAVAIKYTDVAGYWHEAISAPGAITGFNWPDTAAGHWYNIAAVCNGSLLSLYLDSVEDTSTGYQLVAQTDLTVSGSPNTALTAGFGSGGDWQAGNWTVGRGLYGGGHSDRAYGFLDEVRISDSALTPDGFLFSQVPEPGTCALTLLGLGGVVAVLRRRQAGPARD